MEMDANVSRGQENSTVAGAEHDHDQAATDTVTAALIKLSTLKQPEPSPVPKLHWKNVVSLQELKDRVRPNATASSSSSSTAAASTPAQSSNTVTVAAAAAPPPPAGAEAAATPAVAAAAANATPTPAPAEGDPNQRQSDLPTISLRKKNLCDVRFKHSDKEFYTFCCCKSCEEHRDMIFHIVEVEKASKIIWKIISQTLYHEYQALYKKVPASILQVYKTCMENSSMSWLISGPMRKTSLQHLRFISSLNSEKDKFSFIVLCSLLTQEDPHQLLEIISYTITMCMAALTKSMCVRMEAAKDSCELKDEILSDVIEAYEDLCEIADRTAEYVFGFEDAHLSKFGLTWVLLNKKFFQYTVLSIDYMIEPKNRPELIRQFIQIDMELTGIDERWVTQWFVMDEYNRSVAESHRRSNIRTIYQHFDKIHNERYVITDGAMEPDDRQIKWLDTLMYIRLCWPKVDQARLYPCIVDTRCAKCKGLLLNHGRYCKCVTCAIGGCPSILSAKVGYLCCSCEASEKPSTDDILSNFINTFEKLRREPNEEDCSLPEELYEDEKYHIAWAVFKQARGRKRYPYPKIDESYFCKDCEYSFCALARKVLNNEMMYDLIYNIAEFLQPVPMTPDEMKKILPRLMVYMRYMVSDNADFSDSLDGVMKIYCTFLTFAFAEYFLRYPDEAPTNWDHLEIVDGDIVLKADDNFRCLQPDENVFMCFFEKLNYFYRGYETSLLSSAPSSEYSSDASVEGPVQSVKIRNDPVSSLESAYDDPPPIVQDTSAPKPTTSEPANQNKNCGGGPDQKEKCKDNHSGKKRLKKECGHARINETRDRLRKKLHVKNKSTAPATVRTANAAPSTTEKPQMRVKFNIPETKQEICERMQNMKLGPNANVKKSVPALTSPSNTPDKMPDLVPTEAAEETAEKGDLNKWVEDVLTYIEGSGPKGPVSDKKSAKKAKQKQKKEEAKRIEELLDHRLRFHDLYFKEFFAKNELKELKQAKKKDKKKINELENNIKKLNKAKSAVETHILEAIATVKVTNSEFKFSYLPTKELQQEVMQRKTQPAEAPKQPEPVPSPVPATRPATPAAGNIFFPGGAMDGPIHMPRLIPIEGKVRPLTELDPSKRIVTIRRVHVPNLSEPRVTVTTKCSSGNDDKLLYTFVNGQIVATNGPNTWQLKKNEEPTVAPQVVQQMEEPKKTKTQLKKERKRAKALELEAQELAAAKAKAEAEATAEAERIKNEKLEEERNKKKENKKAKKTSTPVAEAAPASAKKADKNNSDAKKLPKQSSSEKVHEPNCPFSQPRAPEVIETLADGDGKPRRYRSPTPAPTRKPAKKIVDQGQFDNNQFKMLHLDDLASEPSASEPETEKVNISPEVKKTKKEMKKAKQPAAKKKTEAKKVPESPVALAPSKEPFVEKLSKKQKKASKAKAAMESRAAVETKRVPKADQNANNIHRSNMPPYELYSADNSAIPKNLAYNTNVSIMEQLNRGVQVEQLTLPPGITLTKVDSSKAEALRAKTESINKLSKPMEPVQQSPPKMGTPYYSHILSGGGPGYRPMDQSGIIMVDTMSSAAKPPLNHPSELMDRKPTKNKRGRRNKFSKKKNSEGGPEPKASGGKSNEPKMVTLRNPMFHGQASSIMTAQPAPPAAHTPIAPMSMDQPATIIKNENGMFTIRNPAMHRAVSNGGYSLGGGPGNYQGGYAPVFYAEPSSSAADTQNNSFSYFSNNPTSMTQSGGAGDIGNSQANGYLSYNGAEPTTKWPSAIGSEIKNAQQQKKSAEMRAADASRVCPTNSPPDSRTYLNTMSSSSMQQPHKYSPQSSSSYGGYNGFDSYNGFPPTTLCCEEASPIKANSSYNHYLDGIPNTGVIQYDDASFLKTLMPGQKLNNEVTIHNVNEANFPRSNTSPMPHRVEITPVYGHRQAIDTNFLSADNSHLSSLSSNMYSDTGIGELSDLFPAANSMLNGRDDDAFKRYNYDYDSRHMPQSKGGMGMDMYRSKSTKSGTSSRSSPFMDDSSLDGFVQNLGSLKLGVDVDLKTAINGGNPGTSPNTWW